jgi:hypothetical protein
MIAQVEDGLSSLRLDWNNPAIEFYRQIGASFLDQWRTMKSPKASGRCRQRGKLLPESTDKRPHHRRGAGRIEAAWQCARQTFPSNFSEIRPTRSTPAHQTADFAELVCSNSLNPTARIQRPGY